MNDKELDQKARRVAKEYRRQEKELLGIIIELDKRKTFYRLGYSSLFSYCTQVLELSPAVTYTFISVARKSRQVPELKKQVISGDLSIHKAQKMTSVLTPENCKTWLETAKVKTHRELEREVALVSPQAAVREKMKYVNSETPVKESVVIKQNVPRVALQMGVSEKLMLKLRRAQDLESQRNKSNRSLEDTLEQVLEDYLEKNDPVRKAARQKAKGKLSVEVSNSSREESRANHKNKLGNSDFISQEIESKEEINAPVFNNDLQINAIGKMKRREPLAAKTIHRVQLRDKGQCTFKSPRGKRCSSRRYLEIHHINPVSKGGDNHPDNLATLCAGHHKVIHSNHGRRSP